MSRDSRILLVTQLVCTAVVIAALYYFTSQVLGFNALTAKALDQDVKAKVDQALATASPTIAPSPSVKASPKLKTATPSATPKTASPSAEEETAKPSATE